MALWIVEPINREVSRLQEQLEAWQIAKDETEAASIRAKIAKLLEARDRIVAEHNRAR